MKLDLRLFGGSWGRTGGTLKFYNYVVSDQIQR
jgi:hypothetical protein